MSKQQLHDIVTPHEHDVLSGRGNFVNYHAGNEHFRALVRKHKVAYVACPKPQKGKFSRLIVDEIRARNPPGRFLKQDPNTKLWHDIGEKKALDKTRQALREGAPEISKELSGEPSGPGDQSVLKNAGGGGMYGMGDGVGGYGAPDLKNEYDDPQQLSQHATLNMMQQQHRMQQPQQQQQLSRAQMMGGAGQMHPGQGQAHPGQLYAGQIQRMQQQQQQHLAQQQQKLQQQQRLQQQQLSRHLAAGGQLGNQLGGGQLGGMGGLGGMGNAGMGGGMGGMGLNPYANFQNDYEDIEPTPFSYNQLANNNAQLQAQLQAQAQLQVAQSQQQQQLQQLQQRQQAHHQQQQNQLRNAAAQQSLASQVSSSSGGSGKSSGTGAAASSNAASAEITTSTLKDESETKSRPNYQRENSEQSLNLGSAFQDTIEHGLLDSGNGDKEKQKMGGSSAHMSFMSLTVSELDGAEDVGVAGDLSSMFDSSLQISDNKRESAASTGSSLTVNSRRKSADESKAGLLDMSVATIGDGMSTIGGLSSALGGDLGDDSQAHMSFSHMFDDSDKNNV